MAKHDTTQYSDFTKLQTDHQLEVLEFFKDYLEEINRYAVAHKLDGQLTGLPDGIVRDRFNLSHVLLDDLEAAFIAFYSDNPDEAPLDLYEHIIHMRFMDPAIEENSQDRLDTKIQNFLYSDQETKYPEFLTILGLKADVGELEYHAESFGHALYRMASYYRSDAELRADQRAEDIQRVVEEKLNQFWALKEEDDSKMEISAKEADVEKSEPKPKPNNVKKAEEKPNEKQKDKFRIRYEEIREFLSENAIDEIENHLAAVESGSSSDKGKSQEWLKFALSLPWTENSDFESELDAKSPTQQLELINQALEEDHAGDGKLKRQLLEFMAAQIQTGRADGKVVCLVGPPGVGKTTFGRSIAKASGRKFARVSVGGETDSAALKGNRFTYVGSKPGKIMQQVKRAGTTKILMMLDEVGRLGSKNGEDPEAILLELLDPSQNNEFYDNYLSIDFDLSGVVFLCTANDISHMSQAVKDRMHIIHHDGYIVEEKLDIAKKHLVPGLQEDKKVPSNVLSFTDEALEKLIREYTKEAGVRMLQRRIETIFNKAILERMEHDSEAEGAEFSVQITAANLDEYCSPSDQIRSTKIPDQNRVGRFNALAASDAGGSIISKQATKLPSNGEFKLVDPTGQLGEMAKETIQVAITWVRNNAARLGISRSLLDKTELRLHSDSWAGAEGPSAGGVMTTLIVSAMTNIPTRRDVAMTGTINYDGKIGVIGGLKQKLDGARSAGVKTVLVSRENEQDLAEIPDTLTDQLDIIIVDTMDDVLKHALVREPKPLDMSLRGRVMEKFTSLVGYVSGENNEALDYDQQDDSPGL